MLQKVPNFKLKHNRDEFSDKMRTKINAVLRGSTYSL